MPQPREMIQWVKRWLSEPKNLSPDPSTHVKKEGMASQAYNSSAGGGNRKIPGLAERTSSRASERLCLWKCGGESLRKTPEVDFWYLHIYSQASITAHTCGCMHTTHVCIHTHIPHINAPHIHTCSSHIQTHMNHTMNLSYIYIHTSLIHTCITYHTHTPSRFCSHTALMSRLVNHLEVILEYWARWKLLVCCWHDYQLSQQSPLKRLFFS